MKAFLAVFGLGLLIVMALVWIDLSHAPRPPARGTQAHSGICNNQPTPEDRGACEKIMGGTAESFRALKAQAAIDEERRRCGLVIVDRGGRKSEVVNTRCE